MKMVDERVQEHKRGWGTHGHFKSKGGLSGVRPSRTT